MPAFSYHRILVMFAGFKHHIGFYPTPSAVKAFAKDLKKYHTATGSIQFTLEKPLPLPLIGKITKFRVKESLEKDGKWRTQVAWTSVYLSFREVTPRNQGSCRATTKHY
jgi:uncharacterized protein YdhG (YjbR/CyaY superfamily)